MPASDSFVLRISRVQIISFERLIDVETSSSWMRHVGLLSKDKPFRVHVHLGRGMPPTKKGHCLSFFKILDLSFGDQGIPLIRNLRDSPATTV